MGRINRLDQRRWAHVRRQALDRDDWRCVLCGRAGMMEVDHIEPLTKGGAPWDLDNLQTLCRDCHFRKTASENRRPGPERQAWIAFLEDVIMLV